MEFLLKWGLERKELLYGQFGIDLEDRPAHERLVSCQKIRKHVFKPTS